MSDATTAPARKDRVSLYLSVIVTGLAAIVTIVGTIGRLAAVAPGHDIEVTVPLAEVSVGLPLGPHGAAVVGQVDTATITVANPAPATLFALWAQPLWVAVATLAGLVLAAVFFMRVARGEVFTRGAGRLAMWGGLVVAAGWLGSTILTNMSTNGALAAVSDGTYESITFSASLVPFLAILLLGGLGGALEIGERLQRDQEGLV